MHMLILEQGNVFGNRLHVQSGLSLCSLKLKGHGNQPLHDFGNGKHTIIGSLNRTQPSTILPASIYIYKLKNIRESVDSLCRDGTDAQLYAILKEKPYNFTTNTLKAYLYA